MPGPPALSSGLPTDVRSRRHCRPWSATRPSQSRRRIRHTENAPRPRARGRGDREGKPRHEGSDRVWAHPLGARDADARVPRCVRAHQWMRWRARQAHTPASATATSTKSAGLHQSGTSRRAVCPLVGDYLVVLGGQRADAVGERDSCRRTGRRAGHRTRSRRGRPPPPPAALPKSGRWPGEDPRADLLDGTPTSAPVPPCRRRSPRSPMRWGGSAPPRWPNGHASRAGTAEAEPDEPACVSGRVSWWPGPT